MRLLLKVIFGNFSESKKSAERRWPSRLGSWVSMLAVSISTDSFERVGSPASKASVPVQFLNWPRTLANIMWRTVKPIAE
jgi:hypothetical protein